MQKYYVNGILVGNLVAFTVY